MQGRGEDGVLGAIGKVGPRQGMEWPRLPWDHAHGSMWPVKFHSPSIACGSGKRLVSGDHCA